MYWRFTELLMAVSLVENMSLRYSECTTPRVHFWQVSLLANVTLISICCVALAQLNLSVVYTPVLIALTSANPIVGRSDAVLFRHAYNASMFGLLNILALPFVLPHWSNLILVLPVLPSTAQHAVSFAVFGTPIIDRRT